MTILPTPAMSTAQFAVCVALDLLVLGLVGIASIYIVPAFWELLWSWLTHWFQR